MRLHSSRKLMSLVLSALLLAGMLFPGVSGATEKMDWSASEKNLQSQVKDQLATKLQLPRISELNLSGITPQNFVPPSDSSDIITVIVELQNEPLKVAEAQAANTYSLFANDIESDIRQEHQQFRTALNQLQASIRYEFNNVFNGFSVSIPANKVDDLLTIPGVKAVFPNVDIQAIPNEPSAHGDSTYMHKSAPHIGAKHLWEDLGLEGKGIKVGVLDTGVDYNHPSLKEAYKGGYNFVDNNEDPMETRPDDSKPIIDGKEYHTTHGTHVAGTVAGRGNYDNPGDSGKVRGVAPQADLYAYRVLGPYGRGSSENIVRGIERAVYEDKVDVINLSLGADYNFQYTAHSVALDNATKAGVVVAVAAGNAGPKPLTLGSPGGAHAAISVAASYPPVLTPVFEAEGLDKKFFSQLATSSPVLDTDKPLEAVFAGFGKPDDFKNKTVKGKLVVVSRGEISFGDKSRNAKKAGAAALIIFNNEAGDLAATLGEGKADEFVPTYTISQADGLILKNYITSGSVKKVVRSDVEEQDMLGSFSSRGPALPDYTIKPDIAAPGVGITSSVPAWDGNYENAYGSSQGTSMASPHIAGAAALLVEYSRKNNLDLTPDEIKALMMNNAVDLKDRANNVYKLTEQGAGRVDLVRSVKAPAIALVQETANVAVKDNPGAPFEYETGSLSFGAMSPDHTVKKTVLLKGISSTSQQYSISIQWPADGGVLTSSEETVSPGQTFDITLQIPPNAKGNYEGHVILTGDGGHEIRLPVSVYIGDEFQVPAANVLEITPNILAPGTESQYSKADIELQVNKKEKFSLSVYDLSGKAIGDTLIDHGPLKTGNAVLQNWEAKVSNGGQWEVPEDGIYYLAHKGSKEPSQEGQLFVIDTEAPEITLDSREVRVDDVTSYKGMITGTVDDQLLHLLPSYEPSQLVQVIAVVNEDFTNMQYATIDKNKRFQLEVPLQRGVNEIAIITVDALENLDIRDILEYDFDPDAGAVRVNVTTSKNEVLTGEEFQVDASFSVTESVYSASFSLIYDASLTKVRVEPSVTLATYQRDWSPDAKLIFEEKTTDLEDGKKKLDIHVSLTEGAYEGKGTLGTVVFTASSPGTYTFKLSDVEMTDGNREPIRVAGFAPGTVVVNSPKPPEPKPEPKPEPGPSSGGSSSSSSYSSTPSKPAGKTLKAGTFTVTEKDGKKQGLLLVSSSALSSQLNDKEATEVKLDLTDIAWNDIELADIRITRALAEQLAASGKALLLSGKDFEVFIPAESLVDFTGKNGDLTVRLALAALGEGGQASALRQVAPGLTVQGEKDTVTKPIRIGLKWSPSAVKDARKVGVYGKDAKEAWTYYAPGVRWDKDGVRFTTASLGAYTAQESSKTFDDIGTHWSRDKVEVAAAHQLIEGKGSLNMFKPNDLVTQAEFASLLDRLTASGKTWSDRIAEPGARDPLTREKMVVMLAQALQLKTDDAPALGFADQAKIGADARSAVAAAVSRGYIQGMGGNKFSPEGTSTRAQAAAVLARVLIDMQSNS
ncbi:MAG: S8 family serine peptidase [Paenibacillus dendritiformis]|uniref:S8 family serine peptidase n=1 Tax=uncultured Paenibacillus sp. TaxID=227322 RepID=UPI0025CDC839|nr:S8 family serine peptidase [uncultured Paenibacillus sp.]MDU5142817.1 S8 family serine peptidase [Paenibacillus dendritiformis]